MAEEIERKFLVTSAWTPKTDPIPIAQGYLSTDPLRTVRIRRKGAHAYITIKGKSVGISRMEYEYEIPVEDVDALLALCPTPCIEKFRYLEAYEGHTWEIDVFQGANEGLILAEIELSSVKEAFSPPPWLAKEVSDDVRYYNSHLSITPYSMWKKESTPPVDKK